MNVLVKSWLLGSVRSHRNMYFVCLVISNFRTEVCS